MVEHPSFKAIINLMEDITVSIKTDGKKKIEGNTLHTLSLTHTHQ